MNSIERVHNVLNRRPVDQIPALESKLRPVLEAGCGYILHSDHSIPPDVEHATLCHFFAYARELRRRVYSKK